MIVSWLAAFAFLPIQQALQPSRFAPITAPVRHAGVFHVATGTWIRGASLASLAGLDPIYDNTFPSLYTGVQAAGEKWQTRQMVPSSTWPKPACNGASGTAPGTATAYTIEGFRFAYCSSNPAPVDWGIEFADLYSSCGTDMVPTYSLALPGLPGGTASGVQQCWTIDVDLSAASPPFVLQAEGNGVHDGADLFGVSWGPTSAVAAGSTGMILAGNDNAGAPADGTIWSMPLHLATPGTGFGATNFFRATGATPAASGPGCYFFGSDPQGMYLELYADTPAVQNLPTTVFCEPGRAGVIGCPCGNPPSGPGRGCENSQHTGGAELYAYGVASLANDSVLLFARNVRLNALSLVVQGPVQLAAGSVFGQGVRCIGGSLKRLKVTYASSGRIGVGACSVDSSLSSRSAALGDPLAPGDVRHYMIYYRDPTVLGGCPSTSTFNATQAVSITWTP